MTAYADASAPEIEVGLAAPEPGPRTLAPYGRRRCTVTSNERAGEYRLVGVEDPEGPEPLPGQFYMLAVVERWGDHQRPYLPRAFSVCRVRGHRLDFLVEAVGPGSKRLAQLRHEEQLWLVGPLGIGFSEPAKLSPAGSGACALLVGGGIGIAALVTWQESLSRVATAVRTLLGFRSASYCEAAALFSGEVALATDDGSAGHHGLVTELLKAQLDAVTDLVVYACGPPAMLDAVGRLCADRSVPAQLAMEESMACGFGACFGCVVRTRSGYRRLCVDGPVVSVAELDFA